MRTTRRPNPLRRGRRRSSSPRALLSLTGVAFVVIAALIGFTFTDGAGPAASQQQEQQEQPVEQSETLASPSAAAALASLEVKGRAPKTGYDRTERFGSAWQDVDRNGCDTRNDILLRDLTDTVADERCRILSGTLQDPYTGEVISFVRGETTSPLVQIDHVVALSDAWQKGAQALSQDERVSLANDPLNLLAVSGRANTQKSDSDAASWLPENRDFWCSYASRQVEVKTKYRLWVTTAEHDALARALDTCLPAE